jgi:hypothetical protein
LNSLEIVGKFGRKKNNDKKLFSHSLSFNKQNKFPIFVAAVIYQSPRTRVAALPKYRLSRK